MVGSKEYPNELHNIPSQPVSGIANRTFNIEDDIPYKTLRFFCFLFTQGGINIHSMLIPCCWKVQLEVRFDNHTGSYVLVDLSSSFFFFGAGLTYCPTHAVKAFQYR